LDSSFVDNFGEQFRGIILWNDNFPEKFWGILALKYSSFRLDLQGILGNNFK
jgi:hypothetical protein